MVDPSYGPRQAAHPFHILRGSRAHDGPWKVSVWSMIRDITKKWKEPIRSVCLRCHSASAPDVGNCGVIDYRGPSGLVCEARKNEKSCHSVWTLAKPYSTCPQSRLSSGASFGDTATCPVRCRHSRSRASSPGCHRRAWVQVLNVAR